MDIRQDFICVRQGKHSLVDQIMEPLWSSDNYMTCSLLVKHNRSFLLLNYAHGIMHCIHSCCTDFYWPHFVALIWCTGWHFFCTHQNYGVSLNILSAALQCKLGEIPVSNEQLHCCYRKVLRQFKQAWIVRKKLSKFVKERGKSGVVVMEVVEFRTVRPHVHECG